MEPTSQPGVLANDGEVLRWSGQVVSAEELRRALNGHRELLLSARAVITPSAAEYLRGHGIRVTRESLERKPTPSAAWGIARERSYPLVASIVGALERESVSFVLLPERGHSTACHWARAVAESVSKGDCQAVLVFCDDIGLVSCVANKVPGVRAAAVSSVSEARRAAASLGMNVAAVTPADRTFFELRQMVRALFMAGAPVCPAETARTLRELEDHAHR